MTKTQTTSSGKPANRSPRAWNARSRVSSTGSTPTATVLEDAMITSVKPLTLAQQFAAESAKNAVPAMLRSIRTSKKAGLGILAGAMLISYPHQAMFLSDNPEIGGFGWAIPGLIDITMIVNVNTLQTVGMDRKAKRRAAVMVALTGATSLWFNVAGSHSWTARIAFALVVLIAVGMKWAGAAQKPDFTAIEAIETGLAAQLAPEPVKPAGKTCPTGCKCGKHNRKAKTTKRTPKPPTMRRTPAAAPVSPAPGGRMVDGLWLPSTAKV